MTMTEGGNTPDNDAFAAANGAPTLTNVRERVSGLAGGFDTRQITTMVGGALGVVAMVLAWSFLGNTTEWAPLMTDLSPEDANAVVVTLDEQGIPYELEAGGSTIMVPRARVYQTRLDVAEVELPSTGRVGYGILDGQGVAASEFTQQVGYQRALEGEFAATIESIEGVKAATVHLALPKNDTFALSEQEASASVLVRTGERDTLSTSQTQAIVNLVASGVEGMSPDDVTVADADGNVLAAPGTGVSSANAAGMDGDALATYEKSVAGAIDSLLVAVVGPGMVRSTVAADVDFDQTSTVTETFSPPVTEPGGAPLAESESTKAETYTGDAAAPEGVIGPQGEETGAAASGNTGYELSERQVNNAVNTVVETTQKAPGTVERMSVAVIVDEEAVPEDQIPEIEALVTQAAGIQTARGDALTVSRLPFDTTVAEAQAAALEARADAEDPAGLNPIYFAAGALLVVLVAGAVTARRRKKSKSATEVLSLPAGSEREGEVAYQSAGLPGVDPRESELISVGGGGMTLGESRNGERQEVLGELIDNQPDEVAQLLRSWLGDRRETVR